MGRVFGLVMASRTILPRQVTMVDKTELWQIVTNIQEKLNYGHLNNRRMQEETLRTPDYVPMLTKELSSVLLVAFRLLI